MNEKPAVVRRISPMLAVADMDVTLEFYAKVLGFGVAMSSPAYSIVVRNNATIHFMKAADESVMNAVRGHTEIYIEVEDLSLLWENARRFAKDHRMREPFDRDYGMREFHIHDPNGCLVFVGQKI